MKASTRLGLLAGGAAIAFALGAFAHGKATGVVKERMDFMVVLKDANKTVADMMRGKTEYDPEKVREAARAMAAHGGESMTRLFPEGSLEASEAREEIWSDWDRFSKLAENLFVYATALEKTANNERAPVGAPSGGMMSGGGMMSDGGMMSGGGTMGGQEQMPSREMLAAMPPDMVFLHVNDTCSACHKDFRREEK